MEDFRPGLEAKRRLGLEGLERLLGIRAAQLEAEGRVEELARELGVGRRAARRRSPSSGRPMEIIWSLC